MKKIGIFSCSLFSCALILLAVQLKAQDLTDESPIKVDTTLYTIPFTVNDSNGRNISGLKKEDFTILQDGDEQEIDFFLNADSPMNVAILIDTSFSTKPVLKNIQKAARDFIKVLRPEDRGIIASFDYRTQFLSELTANHKSLSRAIERVSIANQSGSAMNEAISGIVNNHFATVKGRKAIIVLTDGIINDKAITDSKTLNLLNKSDTILYPVIFKTSTYFIKDTNQPNARLISPFENLKVLADLSSGKLIQKDAKNLKEAFQDISIALKQQYIIGYYPLNTGKPRRIRIRVIDRSDVFIKAKKNLIF